MSRSLPVVAVLVAVSGVLGLSGCGGEVPGERSGATASAVSSSTAAPDVAGEQAHPDVLAVEVARDADGTYTLDVTISSPYDTPERYADGWRVLTPDGTELASHSLAHDHAGEQPFTRTQNGVLVPDGVTELVVEGRDLVNGYGGGTVTVPVPRS